MTWLLVIYLLFQVIFDHWSNPGHTWDVIYFTFQYGWVAAVAFNRAIYSPKYQALHYILALLFSILSINEMTWLNSEGYATMGGPPAYTLSILAIVLFFCYILQKNIQWEKLKRTGRS